MRQRSIIIENNKIDKLLTKDIQSQEFTFDIKNLQTFSKEELLEIAKMLEYYCKEL